MKLNRQKKILEIISSKDIETQYQLLNELQQAGFDTTQATVSRDIKDMRLIKEMNVNGNYRYIVSTVEATTNYENKLRTIFRESVTSVDCAGNLIVIKTLPGLASAACSALDSMEIENLIGSIAGDDTAFLAISSPEAAAYLCEHVRTMME